MMKTRFLFIGLSVINLASCAIGPTQHEIHRECRLEMDAARTAIQLRNQGKDKMAMLRTLPPLQKNSTRLLHQMYQIVDESYACPRLNDIVYGIYRYEFCARQFKRLAVPQSISSVKSSLQNCQAQFHYKISKQLVDCIQAVFAQVPSDTADK